MFKRLKLNTDPSLKPVAEPTPDDYQISASEAAAIKWERNDLRYKLKGYGEPCPEGKIHGALHLWDWLIDQTRKNPDLAGPYTILAHRRLTKTSTLVLYGIWRCREKPNTHVIFLAPKQNQTEDIIRPVFDMIFRDIPTNLAPKKRRNCLTFRNPAWGDPYLYSTFRWIGSDKTKGGNHLRGYPSTNVVIMDEARDVKPTYLPPLVDDVLRFTFVGKEDPALVVITTPPHNAAHPVMTMIKESMIGGHHLTIRASQNCDWTPRDKKIVLGESGDEADSFYLREAECLCIPDTSRMAVPEWPGMGKYMTMDWPRPPYFFPCESSDMGFSSNAVTLFGYVDFPRRLAIIEDEVVLRRCSTRQFADAVKAKESLLFGEEFEKRTGHSRQPYPVRRFADATEREMADFWKEHKIYFRPVEKYDKAGALAYLRTLVGECRLRISPKCKILLFDLENTLLVDDPYHQTWQFERTAQGHGDALAALMYFVRMVPWKMNPNPSVMIQGNIDTIIKPTFEQNTKKQITVTHNPIKVTRFQVGIGSR